jgi:hypothetical protein
METLPEQVTVQGLKSRDWTKHPSTEKHMTLHTTTKILNLQDTYMQQVVSTWKLFQNKPTVEGLKSCDWKLQPST